MKTIQLADFNIRDLGVNLMIGGVVLTGKTTDTIIMLPGEDIPELETQMIQTNPEEFKKLIRQLDLVEVELFDNDKNSKGIVRKTQRQMNQIWNWQVFRRDNFQCRYCGEDELPMTVDHVKLYENFGTNEPYNLTTCCRKCNKTRGNMDYSDWLDSDYYKKVSQNVTEEVRQANEQLRLEYQSFPNRVSKARR